MTDLSNAIEITVRRTTYKVESTMHDDRFDATYIGLIGPRGGNASMCVQGNEITFVKGARSMNPKVEYLNESEIFAI